MSIPKMDCPSCGEPLIEADGRGYYDKDGNEVTHKITCRCSRCNWWWFDDAEPVECSCGAKVIISIDDKGFV